MERTPGLQMHGPLLSSVSRSLAQQVMGPVAWTVSGPPLALLCHLLAW